MKNLSNKAIIGISVGSGIVGGAFMFRHQLREYYKSIIENNIPFAKLTMNALKTTWLLLKVKPIDGESDEYIANYYQKDYDRIMSELDELANFKYDWRITTYRLRKIAENDIFDRAVELHKKCLDLAQSYNLAG